MSPNANARRPARPAELIQEAEAQRALAELFPHLKLEALRAIQDLFPLHAQAHEQHRNESRELQLH